MQPWENYSLSLHFLNCKTFRRLNVGQHLAQNHTRFQYRNIICMIFLFSSSSLPWFPKLTSKPPVSQFCWHFLFVSVETGIIGLRQTPSGPRVEWIQYEFCVCVFFCLTCGFWKFWICFEHFQNWQISCIHPLFQFLLRNQKDLAMPHPRFHVAELSGASTWPSWVVAAFYRRSLCPVVFQRLYNPPCYLSGPGDFGYTTQA